MSILFLFFLTFLQYSNPLPFFTFPFDQSRLFEFDWEIVFEKKKRKRGRQAWIRGGDQSLWIGECIQRQHCQTQLKAKPWLHQVRHHCHAIWQCSLFFLFLSKPFSFFIIFCCFDCVWEIEKKEGSKLCMQLGLGSSTHTSISRFTLNKPLLLLCLQWP